MQLDDNKDSTVSTKEEKLSSQAAFSNDEAPSKVQVAEPDDAPSFQKVAAQLQGFGRHPSATQYEEALAMLNALRPQYAGQVVTLQPALSKFAFDPKDTLGKRLRYPLTGVLGEGRKLAGRSRLAIFFIYSTCLSLFFATLMQANDSSAFRACVVVLGVFLNFSVCHPMMNLCVDLLKHLLATFEGWFVMAQLVLFASFFGVLTSWEFRSCVPFFVLFPSLLAPGLDAVPAWVRGQVAIAQVFSMWIFWSLVLVGLLLGWFPNIDSSVSLGIGSSQWTVSELCVARVITFVIFQLKYLRTLFLAPNHAVLLQMPMVLQ